MLQVLAVVHVLLSASLISLILMHSGRDAGLGGMGFTPTSQGGTHIVERNLTRLTVVVGILFFANTVALYRLLQQPCCYAASALRSVRSSRTISRRSTTRCGNPR